MQHGVVDADGVQARAGGRIRQELKENSIPAASPVMMTPATLPCVPSSRVRMRTAVAGQGQTISENWFFLTATICMEVMAAALTGVAIVRPRPQTSTNADKPLTCQIRDLIGFDLGSSRPFQSGPGRRAMWTIIAITLVLASASAGAEAQTIKPGEGETIDALGHTWSFSKIQDDFTGFNVLKDGKPTSLHGIMLSWDGKTLTLTDHHPYPFDPATGRPWIPPQRTYNLADRQTGYSKIAPPKEMGASPSWRGRLKALLDRNPGVFAGLRQILTKLRGE